MRKFNNLWDLARSGKKKDFETFQQLYGHEKILRDLNTKDWGGSTPLHLAFITKNLEISEILLKLGASNSILDGSGKLPSQYLGNVENHRLNFIRESLHPFPENNSLIPEDPLLKNFHNACFNGQLLEVSHQIRSSSENLIEKLDRRGNNALIFACIGGHTETCRYLISNGANLYHRTFYGATPLSFLIHDSDKEELERFAFWNSPTGKQEISHRLAKSMYQDTLSNFFHRLCVLGRQDFRDGLENAFCYLRYRGEVAKQVQGLCLEELMPIAIEGALKGSLERRRADIEQEMVRAEEARRMEGASRERRHRDARRESLQQNKSMVKSRQSIRLRNSVLEGREASDLTQDRESEGEEDGEEERVSRLDEARRMAETQALREWEEMQTKESEEILLLHDQCLPVRLSHMQRMRRALTRHTSSRGTTLSPSLSISISSPSNRKLLLSLPRPSSMTPSLSPVHVVRSRRGKRLSNSYPDLPPLSPSALLPLSPLR